MDGLIRYPSFTLESEENIMIAASLLNIRALPYYSETGRACSNGINRYEIFNIITNSILLEELVVAQLVKKFTSFYGTQSFITVFERQTQVNQ
jgi:hypothetical protein